MTGTDDDYARLKALFLDLLDLDVDARTRRLADLDADDPATAAAMRERLAAAAQPLPVLDRADTAGSPPQLPHYTLLRELGRGGMGRVWLAERHLGDARQRVALKQIAHADWTDEDRRRFERERRLLAGLQHPHIAALVDGGSDAAGGPYLATEFVDGLRLDEHCERANLPMRERVALLRQVADAVAHAHRHLVVHRDLKPANILVGADGRPKLLDFGIARRLGEETLTAEGSSQMTLRYAAPEQVRDGGDAVGTGSDVYALGVLLYELIAGRSPYGDARSPAPLVQAILHATPTPPSRHGARGADADLDAICLRALRKRPEDRYPGADALAADLDRWLQRLPVEARRGERGYRARTMLRRRWPWLAAAVVIVALAATHIVRLDAQRRISEREREKAEAVAGFLVSVFRGGTPGETRDTELSARELLRRSAERLAAPDDTDPAVRAALLVAAGRIYLDQGLVAEAESSLATGVALLRAEPDTPPATLAAALRTWAEALYESDRAQESLQASLDAVAAIEASPDRGSEMHAGSLGNAAIGHYVLGAPEKARPLFDQALAMLAANGPQSRRAYALMLGNVAMIDYGQEDYAAAEKLFATARGQAAALQPPDQDLAISALRNHGMVLRDLRRDDAAESALARAVAEARAFYGDHHGETAKALYHHGLLQLLRGDLAAAGASLADATRIATAVRGAAHQFTRDYRIAEAVLALEQDRPGIAITRLEALGADRPGADPFAALALGVARCAAGTAPAAAAWDAAANPPHPLDPWQRELMGRWRQRCPAAG